MSIAINETHRANGGKMALRLCYIADANWLHTQRWVEYFVRQGCDVTVVSPRYGEIPGAEVIVFDSNRRGLMRLAEAFIYAIKLRRLLRRLKPDIVHVHFIYNRAFPLNLAFWKINNLAVSTWGRDVVAYTPKEGLNQIIYKRFILKQARLICATSHYLARETARYAPRRKEIHVVPFGVDLGVFVRSNRVSRPKDRTITLGFIKHLDPKYGPEYLLQAIALVVKQHPDCRLIVVGKGEMEEELPAHRPKQSRQ